MKKNILKLSFGFLILSLAISCSSVKNILPKEKRNFQERTFVSADWKNGDPQMRGEMSKDLQWRRTDADGYFLRNKTQAEILKILGEPDRKTRGKCCGAGGTAEGEVWLYNLEVKDEDSPDLKSKQFQIYFTTDSKVNETRVSKWDDKNPDYFPRVG